MLSRKQLEKLGKRYRGYKEVPQDRKLLSEYRNFRSQELPLILRNIEPALDGQPAVLSARAKRVDTIIRKLRRESTMQLPNMADIVGLRVVVPSISQQYSMLDRILQLPLEFQSPRDYQKAPQASGYRGVHLIGTIEQTNPDTDLASRYTYEIQIRTPYQHLWSTYSESFGEQVKEGGGKPEIREFLGSLSTNIAHYEANNPSAMQLEVQSSSGPPSYEVLLYDKAQGKTIQRNPCPDLQRALDIYSYLEEQHSSNFGMEVVLLSANHPTEVFKLTHPRYFNFRGRPEIPEFIIQDLRIP